MSADKKPPDEQSEQYESTKSDSEDSGMKTRNQRKRRNSGGSTHSNKSNKSQPESDFIQIDSKKYTKKEAQKFVRELKTNSMAQNKQIKELSAKIEELNSRLEHISGLRAKDPTSTISNVLAQSTVISPIFGDTSNIATISDCDEDSMDTSCADLFDTTYETSDDRSQTVLDQQNKELFELRQRNRALLSTVEHTTSESSTAVHTNNNNKGNGVSGSSSGQNGAFNQQSRLNNDDNRIRVSKPQQQAVATEANKKLKIDKKNSPEIVVYNIENKKNTVAHIKSLLGHDRIMFRNINKDKTGILTENNVDRKKILEFLDNNDTRFYTYTPRNEKPLNFLIKYVDKSFTMEDIETDLLNLNSEVKILKLKVFETTKPLTGKNIWLLQTENSEKAKNLVGSRGLCSAIVKIEILKPGPVLQCKRCQRFDHAAGNCRNIYRCVKCGKEENQTDSSGIVVGHKPGECPLDALKKDGVSDAENLFCCNCKISGHPANHKKCVKFIEQLEKRNNRLLKAEEKKSMFNNYIESGLSFADKMQGNKHTQKNNVSTSANNRASNSANTANRSSNIASSSMPHKNNTNNTIGGSFIQTECSKLFGEDLFAILSKINSFIPKYKQLEKNQKPMKLLEFLFNLSTQNGS